jgi:hypothetical protein
MALPVSPKDDRADRKQIELLRAAGPGRRAAMAIALSERALDLAHAAIAARYPELTQAERDIKFVELHYGAELAAGFRAHLASRSR